MKANKTLLAERSSTPVTAPAPTSTRAGLRVRTSLRAGLRVDGESVRKDHDKGSF